MKKIELHQFDTGYANAAELVAPTPTEKEN